MHGDDVLRFLGVVFELLAQLEQLKAINTVPQLPDISGALRVLRQQMKLSEQQDDLPLVPAQPAPSGATEPASEEETAS